MICTVYRQMEFKGPRADPFIAGHLNKEFRVSVAGYRTIGNWIEGVLRETET